MVPSTDNAVEASPPAAIERLASGPANAVSDPPRADPFTPTRVFSPSSWLPGGHAQTIVPALLLREPRVPYRRERWCTPDGDFIDLDWLSAASGTPETTGTRGTDASVGARNATVPLAGTRAVAAAAAPPLLVLFHGLEGNSDSHYARTLFRAASMRGWRAVIPHFRSCSGEMNHAPRFYHSGDAAEIDWILRRLHQSHGGPLFAVGVSLGGNALLKWMGEQGNTALQVLTAAAAVSAPVDLQAGGHALARGFNRVYTRHFLATLKAKSERKLTQFPGLFDGTAMRAAQTLYAFDNIVTAPLHGFRDTDDYWRRAASKPLLAEIRVPTLVLNARNDPFLPAAALPEAGDVAAAVTLEQPASGGHVGFFGAWRDAAAEPTTAHAASAAPWVTARRSLAHRLLHYFEQHGAHRDG